MTDEYELLPRDELEHLRHEVEKLKRNPLGDTQSSIDLLKGISTLNTNITKLVTIFESANDDLQTAFADTHVQEQLQRLRSENAKIAHGIVALSELVKDLESKVSRMKTPDEVFASPSMRPQTQASAAPRQQAPFMPTPPAPAPAVAPSSATFAPSTLSPAQGDDVFGMSASDRTSADPDAFSFHEEALAEELSVPNPFEAPVRRRQTTPIIEGDLPHPGEPMPPRPPPRGAFPSAVPPPPQ